MNRRWGCGCGGCLGSVLVVLVIVLGLGYFLVLRPVQSFLAGSGTPAQSTTAPQSTAPQSTVQPPFGQTQTGQAQTGQTQAALTTADVQRFVRVRRDVRTAMGSSFTGVQRVFTDLQNGQTPNILSILGVLGNASSSVGAARSAQQSALTREGLSAERYAYVRGEVNRALGLPQIDLQQVAQAISRGQLPNLNASVLTPGGQNSALITPFRTELTVTAPLGLLGL